MLLIRYPSPPSYVYTELICSRREQRVSLSSVQQSEKRLTVTRLIFVGKQKIVFFFFMFLPRRVKIVYEYWFLFTPFHNNRTAENVCALAVNTYG